MKLDTLILWYFEKDGIVKSDNGGHTANLNQYGT